MKYIKKEKMIYDICLKCFNLNYLLIIENTGHLISISLLPSDKSVSSHVFVQRRSAYILV